MAVTTPEGPDSDEESEKVGPLEQMLSALGLGRKPKAEAIRIGSLRSSA